MKKLDKKVLLEMLEETYDDARPCPQCNISSHPIDEESYIRAKQFINLLIDVANISYPDDIGQHEEIINFEWYVKENKDLLSIDLARDIIFYVYRFGGDGEKQQHGSQHYTDKLDDKLVSIIKRISIIKVMNEVMNDRIFYPKRKNDSQTQ